MSATLVDGEYYQEPATSHLMQGDILHSVMVGQTRVAVSTPKSQGERPGAILTPVVSLEGVSIGPAVVCSYTCGFVAQPPGTKGYAHPYLQVAPIMTFDTLHQAGISERHLDVIRSSGGRTGFWYMPWADALCLPPGDRWSEDCAAVLHHMATVNMAGSGVSNRTATLTAAAQEALIRRLVQWFSGDLHPAGSYEPDRTDSWAPQ